MIENFLLSPSLPVPRSRSYCWRKEMLAGPPGFFYGEVRSKEDAMTKRDRRSRSLVGNWVVWDCMTNVLKNLDICQILELQNWFFFGKETTLPLTVRRWIRASKESLSSPIPLCFSVSLPPYPLPLSTPATRAGYSFAASIKFLPQKTAAILNYAHHLLQAQVDPRSTLCNWLFNRQFENEIPNPWNGPINASSYKD